MVRNKDEEEVEREKGCGKWGVKECVFAFGCVGLLGEVEEYGMLRRLGLIIVGVYVNWYVRRNCMDIYWL